MATEINQSHGAMVGSHSQHRSRQWMELRGETSAFRTGNRHYKQAPELIPLDLETHFAPKTRALEPFRAGKQHSGPEIGIPNISPRAHAPVRPPKPLCSKDPGPRTRPGRKSAPNSFRPSKLFYSKHLGPRILPGRNSASRARNTHSQHQPGAD